MMKEIKLPEIADNVKSAIVLELLVKEGQKVEKDSMLAEMESDKATFELPSDTAGVVKEIKAAKGDEVKVGQVMFIIDTEAEAVPEKQPGGKVDEKKKEDEQPDEVEKPMSPEEKEVTGVAPVLLGGDSHAEGNEPAKEEKAEPSGNEEKKEKESTESAKNVPASPSVRRLAREIGVNLNNVKGSGPADRITVDDVKKYAKEKLEAPRSAGYTEDYELPDFSKLGPVRREKIDTIRRITAKTMTESWQSIPHVFQFDKADITELEIFRKKYSKQVEKAGAKLTVTAILLKLTGAALVKFPRFNASLDVRTEEIIYKDYIHIGVAVDTDRGLLVPVIRDVDKKNISELSVELNELAEKARNKKLMPAEMQGGNFAISNLGGIGGTSFTPIVYRPNVAILGVSRSQVEPVYTDGEFKPRTMLPLSLSYDHRVIDGADGARFLRWLCEAIENPMLTMF